MFKMRALSHADTEKLLDLKTVIEKVEEAYVMKHTEEAALWPMIFHEFEHGVRDMDIKSGYLNGANTFGLKLVSWFGPNKDKGLPQLIGTVMVFDTETGAPRALLSGEHITMMRTGAAGAIGAKYLAKKDSKTLLMVGTGNQALLQIAATLMVMPSIEKVYLWNPMDVEEAKAFEATLRMRLSEYLETVNADFEVVTNIQSATGQADVIITATPSRKAMIMKDWVKPGTHFSCIGSDMSGKQEIDEALFGVARVFTDDIAQSISVGEAEIAFKSGILKEEDILAEIGAVIKGDSLGRQSDDDITIYDSTGIALQDLITANYAIDRAEALGVGSEFEL